MGATATALSAAETTARDANHPSAMGINLLREAYAVAAANLVTNNDGTLAAGDESAAGFDRQRLISGFRHKLWKSNNSGTSHYIVLDLGSSQYPADWLVIEGHNFDGCTIVVEADTSATPAVPWTGATEIFNFSQTGNDLINKKHATNKYTGRYWRITITKATAFIPQATVVWIGRSFQFPSSPRRDSDLSDRLDPSYEESSTKGQIIQRITEHNGLMNRSLVFILQKYFDDTMFSDASEGLRNFFKASTHLRGGSRPFWWCDRYVAAPLDAKLVFWEGPYDPDPEGATTVLKLGIKEQGT